MNKIRTVWFIKNLEWDTDLEHEELIISNCFTEIQIS